MRRIAMIKDGVVNNICLWNGVANWEPSGNYLLVDVTDIHCGIGWTYSGGTFYPPE